MGLLMEGKIKHFNHKYVFLLLSKKNVSITSKKNSRFIVYSGYRIRYCIPEPTCRTRPDSTCVCFSFHSVFFTARRFFPTSPSPSSQIDRAPPTILRTVPPAGEIDPRSIRPPAGDPPVMRRAPPSLVLSSLAGSRPAPATPCATLRRQLPSAGFRR